MILGKIRNQRGAGAFGCLFLILLVGVAMYAGFQIGMPRLRHSSFEDRVNESLGNLRQLPAADVQKQLIQIAAEFDIELTPAQVKVDTSGNRLRIDITYQKLIDLKFWQKTETFKLVRSPAP
jgi:hypothetical protein